MKLTVFYKYEIGKCAACINANAQARVSFRGVTNPGTLHTDGRNLNVKLPARGDTHLLLSCGFAQVTLEIPTGVAAQIHGSVSFGALKVDDSRFPKSERGWRSTDYDSAAHHVDIQVSGGFGAVFVR